MPEPPGISVVIPTRDRGENLRLCLDALARQDPAPAGIEVVVVDDGSREPAEAAVRALPLPFPLRVLRLDPPAGPVAARNAGAAAARGEFLAFLDDDVLPAADWLRRLRARIEGERPDLVQGAVEIRGTGGPMLRRADPAAPGYLAGNLALRRDLFARLGGFDPAFHDPATGLFFRDDADLGFRAEEAGARVVHAPEIRVEHPPPFPDFASCRRHVRRYAFDPLLRRRHPARYDAGIEAKRVLGLRLRRPLHAAALAHPVLLAGTAAALLAGFPAAAAASAAADIGAVLLFRARYRGFAPDGLRGIREAPGFLLLPLRYLAALHRGRRRGAEMDPAPPRGVQGTG